MEWKWSHCRKNKIKYQKVVQLSTDTNYCIKIQLQLAIGVMFKFLSVLRCTTYVLLPSLRTTINTYFLSIKHYPNHIVTGVGCNGLSNKPLPIVGEDMKQMLELTTSEVRVLHSFKPSARVHNKFMLTTERLQIWRS